MVYTATHNSKGHLVIENVPIFVECTRGDLTFDPEWIASAVARAKQAEVEGYLPPLHVRHHEQGPGLYDPVRPAGYFRVRGVGTLTFKGALRQAIFADLVLTDPGIEHDVLADRLPYRSVEIIDVDKPAIDSLALLDHQPPYLELPMLMVAEVDGQPASGGVALATFGNPWRAASYRRGEPVVACFRRGATAHVFLEDANAAMTKPTPAKFEAENKPEDKGADKGGEDMAAAKIDVAAVCAAIADGSISVADMAAIQAAINAQQSATAPEDDTAAASAMVPGEAMKNNATDVKFAAMQGEIEALKAQHAARDAAETRRNDVAAALDTLKGRPLGADLAAKLDAYHTAHGPAAFRAHVDAIVATFATFAASDTRAADFAAHAPKNAPEAALAYTAQGTDAVQKAAAFAAQHAQLSERGYTRLPLDRFVAVNMERSGFKPLPKK